MKKKIVVAGEDFAINRYHYLFEEMSNNLDNITYISPRRNLLDKAKLLSKLVTFSIENKIFSQKNLSWADLYEGCKHKTGFSFVSKSQQIERQIKNLDYKPDFTFMLFGMFSPMQEVFDVPYVYYLDYTMALAQREWAKWLPLSEKEYNLWISHECQAYRSAYHIFPWSNLVKRSLVEDYGVDPKKITVAGSSGMFASPYDGEKKFGKKIILFNGSDFYRKGGDLVLKAFRAVKRSIPDAQLVIIGAKLELQQERSIYNPGHLSSIELTKLFLEADLVVAPARCEPYGNFLVEAMNYGVPCCVSNQGGMPEIVEHGINGIVIPELNYQVLADEAISLLNDSDQLLKMSANGRSKVRNSLNWSSISEKIGQVLLVD